MNNPVELGPLLSEVGINNVVMLSNSRVRTEVLGQVIGSDIPVKHLQGSTRELTKSEYDQMLGIFRVTQPDRRGYLNATLDSKVRIRMAAAGLTLDEQTIIMNVDTVIYAREPDVIEKPLNADEARSQLKILYQGVPYLIATAASVTGAGVDGPVVSHALHCLPIVRNSRHRRKKIDNIYKLYQNGNYSVVPGGVSHDVPEVARDVSYYRGLDPQYSLSIDPAEFFKVYVDVGSQHALERKHGKQNLNSMKAISRPVGWTNEVLYRHRYDPAKDHEITRAILGAPTQVFVAAIMQWLHLKNNDWRPTTNPARNLLQARAYMSYVLSRS